MGLRRRKIGTALVIAAIGLVAMGCFERSLQPVNPCTRSRAGDNIRVESVDEVDLLFMIDNSGSMKEEQDSLAMELPRLVTILTSGDRNADGEQDFEPVRSLHIGVVTSDMGAGGINVPTCGSGTFDIMYGDDGVLLTRPGRVVTGTPPNTMVIDLPGCETSYPSIFEFQRDRDDPTMFAADVRCVATAGTTGCGFEQQLEAVLKALSPATPQPWTVPNYVAPTFFNGTRGHAGPGGMNDGFVRANSALAIIMVTDEEDCSTPNPALFDRNNPDFSGVSINLRCFNFPDQLYPVERYVRGDATLGSGLLGLRQNPNLLIFAAITGVPTETVPDPSNVDYQMILDHPQMVETVNPDMMEQLTPSCNVPGRGTAFPPRRIVRTAQAIEAAGGSATIQSICQESYAGALDAIIEKIADALGGACLPRDLNPDANGRVECQVFEILPATGDVQSCDNLPGRTTVGPIDINGVIRTMCEVTQVGPGGMNGWFYEPAESTPDGSEVRELCGDDGQRISFVGISPTTNSDIRLECLQTVQPSTNTTGPSIGTFCDPEAAGSCDSTPPGTPSGMGALGCDAADRTCRATCVTTADCTTAGLLGDVCDTRPWIEAVGVDEPGISDEERARRIARIPDANGDGTVNEADHGEPHGFCVNPTCI